MNFKNLEKKIENLISWKKVNAVTQNEITSLIVILRHATVPEVSMTKGNFFSNVS